VSIDPLNRFKASALVPIALLSGAWPATPAATSGVASSDPVSETQPVLPPLRPIQAPASPSRGGQVSPALPAGTTPRMVSAPSTTAAIPAAALAAYQRAATVIDAADTGCHLDWPLIAAHGRVESDHGRYGGNVLAADGVSTPGIYGIPLTGSNGTQRVVDTDAGEYDHDARFDRAVGPMQFIPSTWVLVGVDADGDSQRNPQDIDDAALGTAVYLCSGDEDLGTDAGVSSAVYRYNHSAAYVALVKAIARAYSTGSYAVVPTGTPSTLGFGPTHQGSLVDESTPQHQHSVHDETGTPPTSTPADHSNPPSDGTNPPSGQPTPQPTEPSRDPVADVQDGLTSTLTDLQKATAYCQESLTTAQLDALGGLSACAQAYVDGGSQAVTHLLGSLTPSSLLEVLP